MTNDRGTWNNANIYFYWLKKQYFDFNLNLKLALTFFNKWQFGLVKRDSMAPLVCGYCSLIIWASHPEALNTLEEALQGASIVAKHRTLMGVVMEKAQSAKNILDEAFCSLLTFFEVCNVKKTFHIKE